MPSTTHLDRHRELRGLRRERERRARRSCRRARRASRATAPCTRADLRHELPGGDVSAPTIPNVSGIVVRPELVCESPTTFTMNSGRNTITPRNAPPTTNAAERADRERLVLEQLHVEDRARGALLDRDERRRARERRPEQPEDPPRAPRPVGIRARGRPRGRATARGAAAAPRLTASAERSAYVEPRLRPRGCRLERRHVRGGSKLMVATCADRQVDEERPVPRQRVGDGAADQRPITLDTPNAAPTTPAAAHSAGEDDRDDANALIEKPRGAHALQRAAEAMTAAPNAECRTGTNRSGRCRSP